MLAGLLMADESVHEHGHGSSKVNEYEATLFDLSGISDDVFTSDQAPQCEQ